MALFWQKSEKPLNFADQDALNYILDDKHLIYLPKKYNALIKIDKIWDKVSNNEEFPVLNHYADYRRNKPWTPNTDLKNKWNYLYQSYMEHTEPNHKYWWALKSSEKILWSPETEKDFKLMAIHSLKSSEYLLLSYALSNIYTSKILTIGIDIRI